MAVKRFSKRVLNRRPKSVDSDRSSSSPVDSPMSSDSSREDVTSKIRGLRKRDRAKTRR